MIPKIIHYCWFGGKEKPQSVVNYIQTWKEHNPDYIIKEWNETNFDYKSIKYSKEAYAAEKYAFVSDVARIYALMTEGGIYLDTDVRVLKSFDPFLGNISFISRENPFMPSTAVIGSEKDSYWLKEMWEYYKSSEFISKKGNLAMLPNTSILGRIINEMSINQQNELKIYNREYFCAKKYPSAEPTITENTVAIHDFAGSWGISRITICRRLKNLYTKFKCK